MPKDLSPEDIFRSLKEGRLAPVYLFFGPDEFRLERLLDRIRNEYIPEAARDFNLEICYGGEIKPLDVINHAQTLPFMAENRLIIVRRTELIKAEQLEKLIPYLESPSQSTCLIFIASKTDFKRKFYKKIRALGCAVNFMELKDRQVSPWIQRTAKEIGLNLEGQASAYLHQIVGNNLRDLYVELEKLKLRYMHETVGMEQVKELAIHSRIYSIFELMNAISVKDCVDSLSILSRYLAEEDKIGGPLKIIGMLNRQIRLLWQTKSIVGKGGDSRDVTRKLGLAPFAVGSFIRQAKHWSIEELELGISLLYKADRLLKSGSQPKLVLENLLFTLCS